ncbi:TPA: hypothetical protein ACNIQM_002127 [Citrobacter werkmanii]
MKFQDLPKDAQHHALSTLRDLITAGCRKETELELASKVKAAFVAMYTEQAVSEVSANFGYGTATQNVSPRFQANNEELCEIAKNVAKEMTIALERASVTPCASDLGRIIGLVQQLI